MMETEMREFFQRVVDHVAGLSTQANQVEGLQQQLNDLRNRISSLEQENYNLRSQVEETSQDVTRLNSDLQGTQEALNNERAVSAGLRDTIVGRDGRVMELSIQLQTTNQRYEEVERERDDLHNTVTDLNVLIEELRKKFTAAQEGEAHWKGEAYKLRDEVASLNAQFERVKAILTPPQAFADVA